MFCSTDGHVRAFREAIPSGGGRTTLPLLLSRVGFPEVLGKECKSYGTQHMLQVISNKFAEHNYSMISVIVKYEIVSLLHQQSICVKLLVFTLQ